MKNAKEAAEAWWDSPGYVAFEETIVDFFDVSHPEIMETWARVGGDDEEFLATEYEPAFQEFTINVLAHMLAQAIQHHEKHKEPLE